MLDIGAVALYAILAVGYVTMIAITERSAGRFVRGEIKTQPRAEVIAPLAPARPAPATQPVIVSTRPVIRNTRAAH